MDLHLSAARPVDPIRRLWGPVTIRVAWELVRAGVDPRGTTLRAARDHALWRLPPAAGLSEAEVVAAQAVGELLDRAAGRYAPYVPPSDLDVLPTPMWREAIQAASDPIHEGLLRLHYADGLPLQEVERRSGVEVALLRAARDALRELMREVLAEDGVSVEGWEPGRVDALLARIATAADDLCPGPGGLATEAGKVHADGCPRCSRALRLLREGMLAPGDLFPPEDGACVPTATVDLVLVGFLPEGRRHIPALIRRCGAAIRSLAGEVLVIDSSRCDITSFLVDCAERGAPAAAHLRVLRGVVPGRWASRAVIGPGIDGLLARLQGLQWGEVEGAPPLPDPLPPPPSAARWWAAAALMALFAFAAAVFALRERHPTSDVALSAEAEVGGIVFDTDEHAWVEVIVLRGTRAEAAFHSGSPGEKGRLATGDGRYRFTADADAYLIVASGAPLQDLEQVIAAPSSLADRGGALAERLRDRYPGAAVLAVQAPN